MGNTQLFIYYRIPKSEIEMGLRCATALIADLSAQGLAQGMLYQREEEGKAYYTLMEVITPEQGHEVHSPGFQARLDHLAKTHFSDLSEQPQRHAELFTPIQVS